jgi:hypothetical protein
MNWTELSSGARFDPTADEPEFELTDITEGMARLCRFGGQLRSSVPFYSVAEHSMLLTRWVGINVPGIDARGLRTALLHDASEALLGCDVPRPLKMCSGMTGFRAIEAHLDAVLARRFDTIFPFPGWLIDADFRILVDERRAVMPYSGNVWSTDVLEPLGVNIECLHPQAAGAALAYMAQTLRIV